MIYYLIFNMFFSDIYIQILLTILSLLDLFKHAPIIISASAHCVMLYIRDHSALFE